MELLCSPLVLIGGLLALVAVSGIGVITLIKLGVLTRYVFKEEAPAQGDYELEQSHEAGQE